MSENEKFVMVNFSAKEVLEIIKIQEEKYMNENYNNNNWKEKLFKLKKISSDLYSKEYFDIEDFNNLKALAVSKGGFLCNEIRRQLWKKIFCIDKISNNKELELYFIDENKENYEEIDVFKTIKEASDVGKF
jgi:hypothetical protein